MKTKREDMERAYSITLFCSLIVGVMALVASLAFLIFCEVFGRGAMRNVDAQDLLRLVRLVVMGMLPTLGVALIGVSQFMRQYRKVIRCGNAA